jgi:hypothetical protein
MIGFNNFSASYAKCLYAGTPPEANIAEDAPADDRGLSGEDQARMQRKTASLHREIKLIEESLERQSSTSFLPSGIFEKC